MAGMSDYEAIQFLAWELGVEPMPANSGGRWLALFSTAPTSDAGTGGTELSGSAYARVQIAGSLAAGAAFTTSSGSITLGATAPAWLIALGTSGGPAGAGVNVYDSTNSQQIGVVASISGTTVTLVANALHASSGSTDTLYFAAFPVPSASSGTEPAVTPASATNSAAINYAQATAAWSNVQAAGLYDAATSGNLLRFDYVGNFKWLPFTCTLASPGVITSTAHGFSNGDNVVVTAKDDGGALPTTGGSWAGLLTVASSATDTFTAGYNTTSTGEGLLRKVVPQPVPINSNFSFGVGALTLSAA